MGARAIGGLSITLPMLRRPAKRAGDLLGQDTHPTDRTTREEAFEQDKVSDRVQSEEVEIQDPLPSIDRQCPRQSISRFHNGRVMPVWNAGAPLSRFQRRCVGEKRRVQSVQRKGEVRKLSVLPGSRSWGQQSISLWYGENWKYPSPAW